jgi:LCP family protein required for cell wall assembly
MRRPARRKPTWVRALKTTSYLAFCGLALASGTLAGWINQSPFVREILVQRVQQRDPEDIWGGRSTITLLVLGCDEDRYYGGKQILKDRARSDLMLVAKLDFENNVITGVSIPRDTLAAPRGYKAQKINAYHVLGGPDLSQKAVESLLPGVKIDRTVVLDFNAFEDMVDLVGGVDLFVPKKMVYNDNAGDLHINLKPGRQRLNGEDAVGFVRYRKGDDDFHRQDRQKEFLLAFRESLMQNPGKLPKVAEKARDVMGGALSDQEVASLVLFAKAVGGENIKMGMVPTVPTRNYNLRIDSSKLDETLREYRLLEGKRVAVRQP